MTRHAVRALRDPSPHLQGPHPPCHRQLPVCFDEPPPNADSARARSTRVVYLGDDDRGRALEVMAVEGKRGELLVIHAMELRDKYRKRYEDQK